MSKFCCQNGHEISGTLEAVKGVALTTLSRDATGILSTEYDGETKIWWDEQRTVVRDGERVFVCEQGCEVLESEIQELPTQP